jgi:hypothetical protein
MKRLTAKRESPLRAATLRIVAVPFTSRSQPVRSRSTSRPAAAAGRNRANAP